MDVCPYLVEDSEFRDQPLKDPNIKKEILNRFDYSEIYTKDLPENYEVIHDFRMFMDGVNRMRGGNERQVFHLICKYIFRVSFKIKLTLRLVFICSLRVAVVEAYANLHSTIGYYGTETYPVAQYPFNFAFAIAGSYFTSMSLHDSIMTWLDSVPKHGVPTWNVRKKVIL